MTKKTTNKKNQLLQKKHLLKKPLRKKSHSKIGCKKENTSTEKIHTQEKTHLQLGTNLQHDGTSCLLRGTQRPI